MLRGPGNEGTPFRIRRRGITRQERGEYLPFRGPGEKKKGSSSPFTLKKDSRTFTGKMRGTLFFPQTNTPHKQKKKERHKKGSHEYQFLGHRGRGGVAIARLREEKKKKPGQHSDGEKWPSPKG